MQYSTYKNTLQQLAQKIGDVDQEKEEHKCVVTLTPLFALLLSQRKFRRSRSDELEAFNLPHRSTAIV